MKLNIGTPSDTKLFIAALTLTLTSGLAIITGTTLTVNQPKRAVLGVTLTSVSSTPYSCKDTDNGDNPTTKGTVTVTDNSTSLKNMYTDNCISSNTISEYICSATSTTGYASQQETCYNGYCQDGACKKFYTCTDTDGSNTNIKGAITTVNTLTGETKTVPDECYSDVGIKEGVCADFYDAGYYQYSTNCDTGKVCRDGACAASSATAASSTVSFSPSSLTPISTVVAGTDISLFRFNLSTDRAAASSLNSIALLVTVENASLSSPTLFLGSNQRVSGTVPVQTVGTTRTYKITFSKLNTMLTKNGTTEFELTANIAKKPGLTRTQQARLQISLSTNGISWKNLISGQTSNKVTGLPWNSKKIIIQ